MVSSIRPISRGSHSSAARVCALDAGQSIAANGKRPPKYARGASGASDVAGTPSPCASSPRVGAAARPARRSRGSSGPPRRAQVRGDKGVLRLADERLATRSSRRGAADYALHGLRLPCAVPRARVSWRAIARPYASRRRSTDNENASCSCFTSLYSSSRQRSNPHAATQRYRNTVAVKALPDTSECARTSHLLCRSGCHFGSESREYQPWATTKQIAPNRGC